MRTDTHQKLDWSGSLEQLEERVVMSADALTGALDALNQAHATEDALPALEHHASSGEAPALEHHFQSEADFWIDSSLLEAIDQELGQIEQSLANAHDQSGLTQVQNDYGFAGSGQTVAVIDSGIAYDHFALGGGLGPNYRVVGGWDFTGEFDADPYDDGPSGSHGSHVAGIVGADGGADSGVAPKVDLVGLRVFDDAGNGYFSWVEDALQWVHDNRNNFENPITTVNLSLGVATWNSDAIPSWANLEDEFAQLEQDGIFISVSAGNSYTSFNSAGLSYPAASPYVVPVASVDDGGLLSYFSQRNSRVIAAPGRGIVSTVPDYMGDNNGTTDDYASFSGTSMAAPYVAGASVIIREAMEFVGITNITQDMIYDHMNATADSFYDSATNANYQRLNLEAAIDALMPADDYGSSIATAHSLGTIDTSGSVAGLIGALSDQDYFSFTAGATGTVSFSATANHGLTPSYSVSGATGTVANNALTFDVTEGEVYTVALATAAGEGIGYYDAELSLESSGPTIIKTLVAANGAVYTLDSENWVSINGTRLWSKTQGFDIADNQNLVWHGTSGLLQRHSASGWATLDTDAVKFQLNAKSKVYSLGEDAYLSVNGAQVWGRTNDFHVDDAMALYWHSDSGLLQKLTNGGGWSTLDTSVQEFAVRTDGTAYALTADGNVTVNGTQFWTNIVDMRLDGSQQLLLESSSGSISTVSGSFALSTHLGLQTNQVVETNSSSPSTPVAAASTAIAPPSFRTAAASPELSSPHLLNFGRSVFSSSVSQQTVTKFANPRSVDNTAFANWQDTDTEFVEISEHEALVQDFANRSDSIERVTEACDAFDSCFDNRADWLDLG